jgi:hypothetical protein
MLRGALTSPKEIPIPEPKKTKEKNEGEKKE